MPKYSDRFLSWSLRAVVAAFTIAVAYPAAAWQTAHGKPDNSGFADVATAPAKTPRTIAFQGTLAPGAGPVVAPDGTVYIATEQGKLLTFKPDGTAGWSRDINPGERIFASPAIGSDGTIYVIGVRESDPQVKPRRVDSTLHRFSAGGAWLGQTIFPEHNGGGGTTAWPNLWRFNGQELVMVPAIYKRPVGGGIDIRLIAFTPSGGIAADIDASSITPRVTGGGGFPSWMAPLCLIPVVTPMCVVTQDFVPLDSVTPPPLPGVGIFTNPLGGTPFILLSDYNKDLVGLTYSGGTFYKNFSVHDEDRFMRSGPAFLSDGRSIIGVEQIERSTTGVEYGNAKGGAIFSGPNLTKTAPVKGLQQIYATPTRLADGRTLMLGAEGEMAILSGAQVTARAGFASNTIASAAASRSHIFIASRDALQTFDANTLAEVARFDWRNGGKSSPAIGPLGHVYAVAGNNLFVFPPPLAIPRTDGAPGGGVFQDSGIPATPTAPATQAERYKPPMTASNNRLFACEELDGDDCGKGDHREISLAFCQKQGFAKATDFDVDSRKVKAETLDGRFCSKNKCKVFDEIVCAN